MTEHLRRWGACWILFALFVASWAGQAIAQLHWLNESSANFWLSTFENWQSEWLQLLVQAVVVVGCANAVFRKSTEDINRIERKVDDLKVMLKWMQHRADMTFGGPIGHTLTEEEKHGTGTEPPEAGA